MNHRSLYVISGGIVSGVTDFITQRYTKNEVDKKQTFQMALCGSITNGIFIPRWYNFLHKRFGNITYKKVIADQIIYAPFSACFWITCGSIVKKYNPIDEISKKLPAIWAVDLCFWPLCNFMIFKFTPLIYQPYIVLSGDIIWNIFLSYMTH